MKYSLFLCSVLFIMTGTSQSVVGQVPSSPFGVDVENLDVSKCNHTIGCPLIEEAANAGAHAMRLFAIWHFLEPAPNTFAWGELPWQVWYAQQRGIEVHFTATWAPQWANGATSTCPPYAGANQNNSNGVPGTDCQNGYGDVGRTVTNSNYTWTFFYNLASQFNGSTTSGCSTNTASTCRPLVRYFGVWNEPNGMNNFNNTYYNPTNPGNYINDFVSQYLSPAYNGVKTANPSAYILAPELATTGGNTCGGFSGCGDWKTSWMAPMSSYFSSNYDIISIHGYNGHTTDRNNVDTVHSSYAGAKMIWMTEQAATGGTSDLTATYIDQHNRSSYWPIIFYSLGGYGTNCSTGNGLLCSNDGITLNRTAFFDAYKAVYAPH